MLRDGANYIRQEVRITARGEPLELSELVVLELAAARAEAAGSVDGSPVVAGNVFAACEHPMSQNQVLPATGDLRPGCAAAIRTAWRFRPGRPAIFGSVIGVVPDGQLRRGFLYYLERERSQPYRTFLHYNCGYEVGCRFWQLRRYGTPEEFEQFVGQQEKMWLDRIAVFGRELVEKRGVVLDSFVHDHGWDDTERVWQFHQGFPQGWPTSSQAAREVSFGGGHVVLAVGRLLGPGQPRRGRPAAGLRDQPSWGSRWPDRATDTRFARPAWAWSATTA